MRPDSRGLLICWIPTALFPDRCRAHSGPTAVRVPRMRDAWVNEQMNDQDRRWKEKLFR